MSIRSVVTRGYGSFGSISEIVVRGYLSAGVTDRADGVYDPDILRRHARATERARKKSAEERKKAERRLADELDRSWRRIIDGEPDIVEAVRAAVPLPEGVPDWNAGIEWGRVSDVLGVATAILDALERQRLEAERLRLARIQEEDDLTILVLATI